MLMLTMGCSSTGEKTLMKIGHMIVDAEINTLQRHDSVQQSDCPTSSAEHFLMIERKKDYRGYELYYAWISNTCLPHTANLTQVYRGRTIAIADTISRNPPHIATQLPLDTTCNWLVIDERNWIVLYDPKHDRYVAVEELNTPIEMILQINRLDWNDGIEVAVVDTSVNFILPSAPPLP